MLPQSAYGLDLLFQAFKNRNHTDMVFCSLLFFFNSTLFLRFIYVIPHGWDSFTFTAGYNPTLSIFHRLSVALLILGPFVVNAAIMNILVPFSLCRRAGIFQGWLYQGEGLLLGPESEIRLSMRKPTVLEGSSHSCCCCSHAPAPCLSTRRWVGGCKVGSPRV